MKNKGFTLIELLIIIAIIGVLSAVILSAWSDTENRITDFEENCKMYENSTVDRVPVKCLRYFGINSINN